jgi:hypothetical protein
MRDLANDLAQRMYAGLLGPCECDAVAAVVEAAKKAVYEIGIVLKYAERLDVEYPLLSELLNAVDALEAVEP